MDWPNIPISSNLEIFSQWSTYRWVDVWRKHVRNPYLGKENCQSNLLYPNQTPLAKVAGYVHVLFEWFGFNQTSTKCCCHFIFKFLKIVYFPSFPTEKNSRLQLDSTQIVRVEGEHVDQ